MCACRCVGGGQSSHCTVQCHLGFSVTVLHGRDIPPHQVSMNNDSCFTAGVKWRILIGLSLVTFFAPTSSRDRRRWNVFTVYGIAPLAASPSTVAHPISLTSTTPYSVVPGEQPTESNAPLLVAPRPYFKVNRNFFQAWSGCGASWVVCLTRVNNQLPNNNHSHTCSGNVKLKVKVV